MIFRNEGRTWVNKAIFATIQSQLAFSCDEIFRDSHFVLNDKIKYEHYSY